MFRLKKWEAPQTYKPVRFNEVHAAPQDILQVWFAGVHADIGGGYPEKQSGLSKYPLLWMIDEAMKCDLKFTTANINQLAWGIQRKSSPYSYVEPNVEGKLHELLRGAWWILEYLPKSAKYREWPARKTHFGYYIPDAEPRLHSRWRDHPRIRHRAHERDAELPAGEHAGEARDVPDAGATRARCERGGRRIVGWPKRSVPTIHAALSMVGTLRFAHPTNSHVIARERGPLPFSPCGRRWIADAQRQRDG